MPVFRRVLVGVLLCFGIVSSNGVPAMAVTQSPQPVAYVVQTGDNLTAIARRFGTTVARLLDANSLRTNAFIHPGQSLVIPASLSAKLPPLTTPTKAGALPADIDTAERRALIPLFRSAATEAGVPSDLLMALSYTESSWTQSARSADRAVGLGQLLPRTSRWVATTLMNEPALDPSRSIDNLRMTAYYLRYLIKAFPGNGQRALAAYFEGENQVRRHGPSRAGLRYASKILTRRSLFSKVA